MAKAVMSNVMLARATEKTTWAVVTGRDDRPPPLILGVSTHLSGA